MDFNNPNVALAFRDIIRQMVRAELSVVRPKYQYGTVESIDRVKSKCTVLFPGAVEPVPVKMGSVQPSAVGQVVRVDGLQDDRFVADVLGSPYIGTTGGPLVSPVYEFSWSQSQDSGEAFVEPGTHRQYNLTGSDLTIVTVVASCGEAAPVGADLITQLTRNDITDLFSSGLAIADGTQSIIAVPDVSVMWPANDYLTTSVMQVGSTTPGSGLTVTVVAVP